MNRLGLKLDTLQIFRVLALRHMGAYAEMSRSVDEYVRDAERRGDRYAETTLVRALNVVWLVRDDPAEAQRVLERKAWTPPESGYHVQHWYELRARCEVDLYLGNSASRTAELDASFAALARSLLLRVQVIRTESRWLRARMALVAGDIDGAERLARRIATDGVEYARVWATLIEAGVAAQRAQKDAALEHLRGAVEAARGAALSACEVAARRREGELLGDSKLVASADARLRQEGVRDPVRFVDVIAPGLRRG